MAEKVDKNEKSGFASRDDKTGPATVEGEDVEVQVPLIKGKRVKTGNLRAQPLKLEIADGSVANVPAFGGPEGETDENVEPVADFTKEDAKLLAIAVWNIPGAILGDHLTPDQKLVERFGEQLYGYCNRKGINLYDYVFDELPLVISGAAIGGAMVKAQLIYMAEKKAKKEEEEKEEKEK